MCKRRYVFIGLGMAAAAVVTWALASAGALPIDDTTATQEKAIVSEASILAAGAAAYAKPDVLVDTAWVLDNLENENVRLVDVSSNQDAYNDGHLPGAVFVSWRDELTNPDTSVEGQILTAEQLGALFSELGIANDHTVVFYDNTSNLFATRAYWALKYYGHAEVRVYNGGSLKWVADGHELSRGRVTHEPTEYVTGEPDPEIRTDWQYVVDHIDDEETLLCDTRSVAEFTGDDARAARGGHIPGAVHLEWVHAVNEDGTFKSAPELAALFYAEGFTPDKQIITYCQTGVRGAHTWFVLRELLGYPNVRNYDGSWAEWGNNEASPIS